MDAGQTGSGTTNDEGQGDSSNTDARACGEGATSAGSTQQRAAKGTDSDSTQELPEGGTKIEEAGSSDGDANEAEAERRDMGEEDWRMNPPSSRTAASTALIRVRTPRDGQGYDYSEEYKEMERQYWEHEFPGWRRTGSAAARR